MNSTKLLESVELFQLYYTPVLVHLGALGNCLCIYVFRSPKLRKLSTSCYLSALAISDTVFLIALFTVWLTMVGLDIFNQSGPCQAIVYLTAVCSFLSAWFVVAFTVERFVAVRYPLLRSSLCTVKRAKLVLTILTVFALGLYSPMLIFADAHPSTDELTNAVSLCTVKPPWKDAAGVFNAIDTIVTFVIPMLSNVDLSLFMAIQHMCMQFFNTNFGINFILYCVGGVNFRRAVLTMLCCQKHKRNEEATPRGTTTPISLSQSRTLSYRSNRGPKKHLHQTMNYAHEMTEMNSLSKYQL